MFGHEENNPLDAEKSPPAPRFHFPLKSLRRMAEFIRKRRGRSVPDQEADEALGNLTRYFKWLRAHKDDLKDDAK